MNTNNVNRVIGSIPANVSLIAVTKNQSIDDIKSLQHMGIDQFAENKVQQLLEKQKHINNANWHFIGRIQSNKIKKIVEHSTLIHSVSELRYLQSINSYAQKLNKKQQVLIQLNIAQETSKKGMPIEDFYYLLDNLSEFPYVLVCGMMVIGNDSTNTELIKQTFEQSYKIFTTIRKTHNNFTILSMGMSNDYKLAIECGSTMVRVGTALFSN